MQHKRRRWDLRKKDILNSIDEINKFLMNVNYDEFFNNNMVNKAVTRCLEIIGEASKYAPEDLINKYNKNEWRKISNMRNIIAHDYFDVDLEIVWEVVQSKLPKLKEFLEIN